MARFARVLSVTKSSSTVIAEPPEEAVNLESDFVVIMAALLCALICVVGLIAVARCAWLRRSTNTTPTTTNGRGASARSASLAAANKGLKKKVLQSLPKFTYTTATATATATTPDSNTKFASSECAICLGEFEEGEEVRVLPQCGHGFHVGCIDTWLGSHSSCPSCRQILVVAKCQKCGQAELKARQQDHVVVNNDTNSTISNSNNNNSNVSSSSSNVHVVTFLP